VTGRIFLVGVLAAALIGVAVGLAGYTFVYAKGYSYLTDNPRACANCHIMNEQYAGWIKSSHRSAATCNDCHTPASFLPKYWTKASNGFWHSYYFTGGTYPDQIELRPVSRRITEQACRRCHGDIVRAIERVSTERASIACLRCHASVGHLH
jgi:cytochrome c nitrite reductase small subunit